MRVIGDGGSLEMLGQRGGGLGAGDWGLRCLVGVGWDGKNENQSFYLLI